MLSSKWVAPTVTTVSAIGVAIAGLSSANAQSWYQNQTAAAAGKAILACPARATVANPNFAELDISTGIKNNAKWWVRSPPSGAFGVAVTPMAIPGNWAPDTATSAWITTPDAATGTPQVGVYSYWLDFGMAPCPRTLKCTVSIDAKVAADDQGGYRTTANPWNTPALLFGPSAMTVVKQSWPGLTGYHTITIAVHNASVGETGFHLSGKLKRQCF